MSETKIDVDLDPKNFKKGAQEISESTEKLAEDIDDALGKNAVKSVKKLEEASEKGSTRIKSFFSNLGTSMKEDLKTAFDFGRVMSGLKFGKNLTEGLSQILDMEKAFAKLNTRMMLSGSALQDFKRNIGSVIASTGQKLEDVLPGVETMSAKGNIRDPRQLTAIAGMLAKVRGSTGEDVTGASDETIDILKAQGSQINAKNIKAALDALSAARVNGAFKTVGEAGSAVRDLSPFGNRLGMGTREMAGAAAIASKAGEHGQNILKQIMEKGTTVGGQQQLNAVLGQNIFKNGKLDIAALGKINTGRFGNQQIMEQAAGLTGANGQDLKLFVDAFKDSMPQFKRVVTGSDETAKQFEIASDNLGTSIDKFKEGLINSVRSLGDDLANLGNDAIHLRGKKSLHDLKNVGGDLWDNKWKLAGGLALTAGVGAVTGGGLKALFGKLGGKAGMAGDLAIAKGLEKAAGVTPVFVVNANEIGNGGQMPGQMPGGLPLPGLGVTLAGTAAVASTTMFASKMMDLHEAASKDKSTKFGWMGLGNGVFGTGLGFKPNVQPLRSPSASPEEMKKAIIDGTVEASEKIKKDKQVIYTNPSKYPSTGGKI